MAGSAAFYSLPVSALPVAFAWSLTAATSLFYWYFDFISIRMVTNIRLLCLPGCEFSDTGKDTITQHKHSSGHWREDEKTTPCPAPGCLHEKLPTQQNLTSPQRAQLPTLFECKSQEADCVFVGKTP